MSFVKKSVVWSVKQLLSRRALVALGVIMNAGLAAHAIPVGPGGTVFPVGTTAAARPELNGVVLRDVYTVFAVPNGFGGVMARGWIQDRVVRSSLTGRLHFYYRIQNYSGYPGCIAAVRRSNFGYFTTDVDYRWDGLGTVGVKRVSRSAWPGSVLTYDYTPGPILPGMQSRYTFALTNRYSYNVYGVTSIVAYHPLFGYRSTALRTAQPI